MAKKNKVFWLAGPLSSSGAGPVSNIPKINADDSVSLDDIGRVCEQLKAISEDWNGFCDPIVSVRYKRIIPKSKRVSRLFPSIDADSAIVGARYENAGLNVSRLVIVYRIPKDIINKAIEQLFNLERIVDSVFGGVVTGQDLAFLFQKKSDSNPSASRNANSLLAAIARGGLSKTTFGFLVMDVFNVREIFVDTRAKDRIIEEPQFVSFYNTGFDSDSLLKKLGLLPSTIRIGDDRGGYAYQLSPKRYKEVVERFPYLVSMSVSDVNEIPKIDYKKILGERYSIPSPGDEPVIGVIDTFFSPNVYFSDWVDSRQNEEDETGQTNWDHATAVCSILVDGPTLNKELDDGCGRFRVRHFGLVSTNRISVYELYVKLEETVRSNTDIKVWNLSLGSMEPVDEYSISPLASLLDRLQSDLDVVFVVSGTNAESHSIDGTFQRIGSPADSVNSIVVNAVDSDGNVPSYARRGPVLHYFTSPDFSVSGGKDRDGITVATSHGFSKLTGTSFAAPWVARKLAFLICKLNLSRECAKALLIDAACGWDQLPENVELIGRGILPQRIEDIVTCDRGEIKFFVSDVCTQYRTGTINIPVPAVDGRFPFAAKATLCYFPTCSRKQGVDYTDCELDLHFGRTTDDERIKTIDNNMQGSPGIVKLPEVDARRNFDKWNNVKHVCQTIKPKSRGNGVLSSGHIPNYGFWGFQIDRKLRGNGLAAPYKDVKFGLVITLRSVDSKYRYDDFRRYCSRIWKCVDVDIDVMNRVYEETQEEVVFED